jgi:hypothetical protein
VIAQAVEAVVEAGADDFLEEVLPAIAAYYRYLACCRDPDRDGLISIISRFESGLDFSPAYDLGRRSQSAAMIALRTVVPQLFEKALDYDISRIFQLSRHHFEDVLVNSTYADGLQALARLATRAGQQDLRRWAEERSRGVIERLLERSFDERRGLFFNLVGPRESRANRAKTVVSLVPLLLHDLPNDIAARLLDHLTNPREFWTSFPVPSVARDEPTFSSDSRVQHRRLIWRGPSSMSTNWLLVRGLRRHGHHEVAEKIAGRSRILVQRGGFNEFFDPETGAPVGAPDFGWATLAAVL